MSVAATEPWEKISDALRSGIDPESYDTWIQPLEMAEFREGVLTLRAPNGFSRNWVLSNYREKIEEAAQAVFLRDVTLRFEVAPGHMEDLGPVEWSHLHAKLYDGAAPAAGSGGPVTVGGFTLESIPFNSHLNFDNFVVGESNRFAHAAAQKVADPESRAYNPLFLYGGVGLGKTHLLHAIGRQMMSYGPHIQVLYVSSETFMNAFIECIQSKDVTHFRNCFRSVDLLLIDDVQFFAGAERTQTEFFHTFNSLYAAGKKIVISSDQPPKELHELEERLRSRFEQGLIVDIQPPDLETRVAILRRKAAELRLELTSEVEIYIAERIKTNIRKLEGALTKLSAHMSVSREPVGVSTARGLLGAFLSGQEPVKISVEKVQTAVCKYFDLNLQDLTGDDRSRKFSYPRQIACYLAREMTDFSYPEIARKFGGRDHTSILHAHRKIQRDLAQDMGKQNLITYLTRMIKDETTGAAPRN